MAVQAPGGIGDVGGAPDWRAMRREERYARRSARRTARGAASGLGGLGLIVVGCLFLLQNAGYVMPGQIVWGALCYVLAAGAAGTAFARYAAERRHFTPLVASATSGALLLAFVGTMLAFDLSWGTWWPMFLIIPGAMAVLGSAARSAEPEDGAL